ncbi:MAG: response regulator, partial [Pseudomonadales bacterium]|nr:response regulator [Pseudomonadales bacterium]
IRTFLRTKENNPFIDTLYKTCMKLAVIYMFIDLFMAHDTSLIWSVFVTQLILLTFFPIAIYLYLKGNEDAKFFGIAWGFNIFALLIYGAIAIDLLPSEPILLAMAPIGILSEAILLSLALAERLKRTQRNLIDADKRAMEQLSRYQSIFNNALEGIYQLSLEGKFISVNPAMAKFLGYRNSEDVMLAGRSAVSLCYQQPQVQYKELSEKRFLKEEISLLNLQGSEAWADHSAKLIFDDSGNPLHIEGTLVDITDRKLRERAYREREQERLENALAKETAAAKSEFLAKMSHEIRTSLTSIIGLSEAIKSLKLTGSQREDSVKTIAHSSQELLGLINNILDYSKIEAGKLETESIAVDFEYLLSQIDESFRFSAENKGLAFETMLVKPFPKSLLTDPTRLNQILHCIIRNAIENTKAGAITVTCSWSISRNELTLSIKDTGTGITQEAIDSLFTVFTQTAPDEIRQYGNAGLGLPIAKELALIMKGDITVKSDIGFGSEFIVRLASKTPVNVQWIDDDRIPQSPQTNAIGNEIPALTGNLLLAEDNPVNQKLVEKIVSKTGLKVFTVNNGRLALDVVLAEKIDLILMDINMPEMNGLEATQYLREQGFDMPIFALTAETDQIEIERALDIGCDGYLQKPVDKAALYQTLSEHLSDSVNDPES